MTKKTVRLLVCGGREYGSLPPFDSPYTTYTAAKAKVDRETLYLERVLDAALKIYDIEVVIHGAARGADRLAGEWAKKRGIPDIGKPANWNRDKKAAGPIRNQAMLDEDRPSLVIAFPGGNGTTDMVTRSRKAGIRVIEAQP